MIENERKKKEEEEKKKNDMLKITKKKESFSNFGKNGSNSQLEQVSSYSNYKNARNTENSNQLKKNTIRDSEILEQELIEIDSRNNDIVNIESKNNNFISDNIDENNLNDFKKIYDKEVSNKLKYELQKDLLDKQKKSYNMMILSGLRNKSENGKKNNFKINNLLDNAGEKKRNKLTLLDLENKKDKNIKDIEKLLKGGVDENKLMKLENIYKDNKEIMNIINNYKNKKMNLENNFIEEPSSSNSLNIININRVRKPKIIKDEINVRNKEFKLRPKSGKNSHHSNISVGNPNNHRYNQSSSSIQDFYDLAPFYYISNGNKLSKNMWGYNDYINKTNDFTTIINNNMTQEQIIQNKLKIYKDKVYKPFFDKVEKEKHNEYKRLQILRSINDPKIKSNLENKFGIDRGKIDFELNKEKEKINKAIRDYETKLLINQSQNRKVLD